MPLPNEHSCHLKDSETVTVIGSRKRTSKNGKEYKILFGISKRGSSSVEQAYRYSKKIWTADEARAHCKRHGGNFEAALVQKVANRLRQAVMEGK